MKAVDMNLRDWFAGLIIEGMMSGGDVDIGAHNVSKLTAKIAYEFADALVDERTE